MNGQGNSWRNLLPGMVLVALGVLFLADKFYAINFFWYFRTWWPLLLIGFGVLGLLNRPRRPVGPIVLITVGVIFQVDRLDIFPWWSMHRMWPVILIAIGLAMLVARLQRGTFGPPRGGGRAVARPSGGGMKRNAIVFLLLMAAAAPLLAQSGPAKEEARRAQVLVLGVYHMSNPGHDIFNMKADDVLAPKRQAEIAQLMAVLKKYQPTKIAVERDPGDNRISKDYPDYLAGKHELTRNEIEQIGFRLAKELGHKTVYGVDADGEFPYPRLVKYAKATERSKEFDAMMAEWGDKSKAENAYLTSHTVLETLLYMNSDDKVAEGVGFYYQQAHFGEPWDWAGADLVSDWFRRNMRIYSNVVQLADSPNERVLVIFGAGHLGWLRHDFASDPSLRLRKLAEFVK